MEDRLRGSSTPASRHQPKSPAGSKASLRVLISNLVCVVPACLSGGPIVLLCIIRVYLWKVQLNKEGNLHPFSVTTYIEKCCWIQKSTFRRDRFVQRPSSDLSKYFGENFLADFRQKKMAKSPSGLVKKRRLQQGYLRPFKRARPACSVCRVHGGVTLWCTPAGVCAFQPN